MPSDHTIRMTEATLTGPSGVSVPVSNVVIETTGHNSYGDMRFWRQIKANGWASDFHSLEILADGIKRDLLKDNDIAAGFHDPAGLAEYKDIFRADRAEAIGALSEIHGRMNAFRPESISSEEMARWAKEAW